MRTRLIGAITAAMVAAAVLPRIAAASPEVAPEKITVLVMFESDASALMRASLRESSGAIVTGELRQVDVERLVVPVDGLGVYERAGFVRAVELPRTLSVMGKPNDPLLKLQWGLKRVRATDAWKVESGKKADVKVGVIDTGVDASHEDLSDRVLDGFDFLDDDADPYDDNGHGTHVAGVIAANASNKMGIAGLSMGATIIPEKACGAVGTCPIYGVYAAAIDAVVRGANVINLSLGAAGECTEIDQAVFDWVRSQGTFTVVAAGNAAQDKNPTINPANCDNTFAVGAIDDRGRRASFSSYGDFVDIAAPGVDIWSTVPPLVSLFSGHIGYDTYQGTSMASPHVAGAAALVVARHPEWTPDQIESKLVKSAVDAGKKGRDDLFGNGILNILAALK